MMFWLAYPTKLPRLQTMGRHQFLTMINAQAFIQTDTNGKALRGEVAGYAVAIASYINVAIPGSLAICWIN